MNPDLLIALSLLIVGFLYASVGHGGASGYLAVLSLFAVPVMLYKPMILVLNMVVAGIGFIQFYRAGYFRWDRCWPFLISSIPLAYVGSMIKLPEGNFHLLLGIALVVPVIRLLGFGPREQQHSQPVNLALALLLGGMMGFLAGLLNIGGGIFLSPVLVLLAWANAKEAAAVSSLFIVLNSFAGLLGNTGQGFELNYSTGLWFVAAVAGGAVGAYFGSHRFALPTVRFLLSTVLLLASVKLIFFM
ncbi:sulfite exporter TauE/SafE family protein [Cesiribacter sp. SM1]|uniref:sulfite exporter TauE/SafE family protein n=1 Tax=Cesiribacter sp. SM1 TaxID=2861196 RepID=UPI001CD229FB|nr:sulfite exporter TauE/SafE family protein [Cesiribacter sp. SM1]